ncbi:HhH-GDP family DNA glycosylase [Angustibacter aerolatus]
MGARVTAAHRRTARALLDVAGTTYAQDAGIRLRDTPSPLFRLLVLSSLLATRIKASIAVDAARELDAAGCTTPRRMHETSWQHRVDALGRAHYRRYDESTATRLGDAAALLLSEHGGDVRRLVPQTDAREAAEALQQVPGLGPVGASIFLREAQAVWPWLRPYTDDRVSKAAQQLDLPTGADALAELAGTDDLSRLTAALVRASLDRDVRRRIAEEVGAGDTIDLREIRAAARQPR